MKAITKMIYSALALFAFACFALVPQARAACQDGCDTISRNTFQGDDALISNTTGVANTAVGFLALSSNTEGYGNTAFGASALVNNTTGYQNAAIGSGALATNALTFENTAIGFGALDSNTAGALNTVTGANAGGGNTTGSLNTVTGAHAFSSNTGGHFNTVVGAFSLNNNTTGSHNTVVGQAALPANTTGSDNIALGDSANLTTGSDNIDIGNNGVAGEGNTIRIGTSGTQTATFIAGIRGTPITGAVAVGVNSSGQLGVRPSSARFKEAIKLIGRASEAILALKPITFRYKKELDAKATPQFGLIAEELAKVNPDLVVTDDQGKPLTVRYDEVNAMLLNEFLKEHRKVEQQRKDFEAALAQQQKRIDVLTAGLQKVSAQLDLNKRAPETLSNNQ